MVDVMVVPMRQGAQTETKETDATKACHSDMKMLANIVG